MYSFISFNFIYYVLVNWVSVQFIGVVLLLSSMVILYSTVYIKDNDTLSPFYILVNLFILSIVVIMLSPKLGSFLLGCNDLGLISYLVSLLLYVLL